jgi:hypothetical protein
VDEALGSPSATDSRSGARLVSEASLRTRASRAKVCPPSLLRLICRLSRPLWLCRADCMHACMWYVDACACLESKWPSPWTHTARSGAPCAGCWRRQGERGVAERRGAARMRLLVCHSHRPEQAPPNDGSGWCKMIPPCRQLWSIQCAARHISYMLYCDVRIMSDFGLRTQCSRRVGCSRCYHALVFHSG